MNQPSDFDVTVDPQRSHEILVLLATYHGLAAVVRSGVLKDLVQATEQRTINAFYKHFTHCKCPSNVILLCIIEETRSNGHRKSA